MVSLILKENSFQFNGKDYLQTHGTAMGTKMAVQVRKRFIDDVFPLWNITKDGVENFIEQANKCHPTIKFTVEISEK